MKHYETLTIHLSPMVAAVLFMTVTISDSSNSPTPRGWTLWHQEDRSPGAYQAAAVVLIPEGRTDGGSIDVQLGQQHNTPGRSPGGSNINIR